MSQTSTIEWTDATWNPVLGCSKISPECKNCYAIEVANQKQAHPHPNVRSAYAGLTCGSGGQATWTGVVRCLPERLAEPFRWPRKKLVFVNSMSDLFHEQVPEEFIRRVFEVMERAPWHTFQILTKRAERLAELGPRLPWPAHVWAGVSVENQSHAGRVDLLRQVPACVRWVSAEPLLGPLGLDLNGIAWVVTGGESGSRFRALNPDWVRGIRNQCAASGVAFFHKQNGGRKPKSSGRVLDGITHDDMPAVSPVPLASLPERKSLLARFEVSSSRGSARTPLVVL